MSKPELRTLNEQIYWYLLQQIINNKLKPGSRINYEELSQELGVSKTPLRDAFNRLAQEGFVEIKPRSGTFVKVPNLKDAVEIYDLRKGIERVSVALAIDKIPQAVLEELLELTFEVERIFLEKGDVEPFLQSDWKLHQTIAKYSGNSRVLNILESLNAQNRWLAHIIIEKIKARTLDGIREHKAILQAMLQSDVKRAVELMEKHIETVKSCAIEDFSQ